MRGEPSDTVAAMRCSLVALALVATGCAASNTGGSAPVPPASASAVSSAQPGPNLEAVASYMRDNFQDATWFSAITGYSSFAGGVQVETRLAPSGEDRHAAGQICTALIGEVGQDVPVRVAAGTGERLILKRPGGTCTP